jgi:hypothetical protein
VRLYDNNVEQIVTEQRYGLNGRERQATDEFAIGISKKLRLGGKNRQNQNPKKKKKNQLKRRREREVTN